MRKSTTLLAFTLPFAFFHFSSGAKPKPTDQSARVENSGYLVNLVVDYMSELSEDSGAAIRVNADFDEKNKNKEDNPLSDYQPDEIEGHRIVGDDPNLKDGLLSIDGSGTGRWKLLFPENIKVWKKADDGEYEEVISSRFAHEAELPFSCELKVEGIKGSQRTNGVKIVAEFVPAGSRKAYQDSVFLTVLETKFAVTFDDGPIPEKTEKIVRALKKFHYNGEPVRAAFFQIGAKIRKFADLTRFVHKNGHLVFNRAISLERRSRTWWNSERIEKVLLDWEEEIFRAIGRKPDRFIRARYLKEGGRYQKELKKAGARVCGGELVFDFRAPSVEVVKDRAEEILEKWNTRENPKLHPYPAILIFHEFPQHTYDHVGEVISYLQDRGFMLVNFDPELAY